jgi:voltage-gated potassium channel Kch
VAGIGLRLARRLFGRRKFHYIALVAIAVVLLGALGVFLVERGSNRSIGSFGDALWWAVVTATTVGYGDVSPVTLEGRLIAVVLMLTGIGVIGVFTATVAALFFEQTRSPSWPQSPRDSIRWSERWIFFFRVRRIGSPGAVFSDWQPWTLL